MKKKLLSAFAALLCMGLFAPVYAQNPESATVGKCCKADSTAVKGKKCCKAEAVKCCKGDSLKAVKAVKADAAVKMKKCNKLDTVNGGKCCSKVGTLDKTKSAVKLAK